MATGLDVLLGSGGAQSGTGLDVLLQGSAPIDVGSPTDGMSTLDKLRAGAGMGMSKIARAVGQATGLVSQSDINEANRIDSSLAATATGKVGSFAGQTAAVLPAALVPGANTYLGASLIGAGVGGLTTEGGLKDRAIGAGAGAAGGAAGKFLGDQLGNAVNWAVNRRVQAGFDNAGRDAAAQAARGAGYVIPPADTNPTITNELLNGLSGKIKTAQTASAMNQGVTNDLARTAIGAPSGQPLDMAGLNAIRNQAGRAYQAVSNAGTITPGPAYGQALDNIVAPFKQAQAGFPGASPSPVIAQIEALRSPQFDASSAVSMIQKLRGDADAAYGSGNKDLGRALKQGASALEDAIDTHLSTQGQPASQMLDAFRNARQLIAKSYSVQSALNPATGDVSAQAIAKRLGKGRPLSDELLTIAQAGQAFPKATQALKEAPKQFSPVDFMTGLLAASSTGHPGAALLPLARPAVRMGLLSGGYQNSMGVPSYTAGTIRGLLEDALQSQMLQSALPAQSALLAARSTQ